MPATPQDHKPKKATAFKFTGSDGKRYTLPLVTTASEHLTGGEYEDAVMDEGGLGWNRYLVLCVRASGASTEALDALRALPQPRYFAILGEWAEFGDGDGAALGE